MPLYVYISFCEYRNLIAWRTVDVLAGHCWETTMSGHAGWLIKMRQVCKIIAGFEYGRVHERRKRGIVVILKSSHGGSNCF